MAQKKSKHTGRPSRYHKVYVPMIAELLASSGKLDRDIYEQLGIGERTFYTWRKKYPELAEAIDRGKTEINKLVEAALVKAAIGYFVDEGTVRKNKDGKIIGTWITRRWIQIPSCIIFFLKNRLPDKWRDKREIGVDVETSPAMALADAINNFRLDDDGQKLIEDATTNNEASADSGSV